jgi:hypothetical protein
MKKIINGKKYDTETANKIAEYWNGYSKNDFRYTKEILYHKKNGEFFLYAEGGGMSNYAVTDNGSSSFGIKIITLTINEAKEWAEQHMESDEYEDVFGEVAE